ncbi:MAG: 23S rRNA (adenine(2503)-C(2))-methyltransferase RlmN [bacterium]
MQSIFNLTIEEMKEYFISKGDKPYRSTQIFEWLYRHKIKDFSEMTNQKQDIINMLKTDFNLNYLKLVTKQVSVDKTVKFLFELEDGELIETVLMNHEYGKSLCVTTQVGCNMGCKFCASGIKKKVRNLTTGEIITQILTVEEILNIKVSHIVIMGIGEPFDNYGNVMKFLNIANYPKGLEIGARHMSVSTCGLVNKIKLFQESKLQSNLAISLHASNNDIRNQIMPVNKKYDIYELIQGIKEYIDVTNRRVTIEYILIKDLNDKKEHANELANLLRGMNVYVNLIPYNEVIDNPFKRSTKEAMKIFYDTLKKKKLNVTLRQEQGHDIDAACGQLRSNMNK